MKAFIRIISVFLALVMLAAIFVGCDTTDDEIKETENTVATTLKPEEEDEDSDDSSNNNTNNNTNNNSNNNTISKIPSQTVPPASSRPLYDSTLPENMNWGGEEYLVLGQSVAGNVTWENFEIARDERPNDIIGIAVWERNAAIKQKYNVNIKQELVTVAANQARLSYVSNEDKYDMVMYQLDSLYTDIECGYLVDLTSVNYIDFDNPAWNSYANEQLALGTVQFAATGDFNLQNKIQLSCLYYNRDMFKESGLGLLEDMVIGNTWTLDSYEKLVKAYSVDENQNGTKGEYAIDTFGLVGDRWNYLNFSVGAGYRASVVTPEKITLVGDDDDVYNILSKVGNFFFDKTSTFITEDVLPLNYSRSVDIFNDGRALFFAGQISDVDSKFENVDFEIGILPFPKLDSKQEDYYTQVNYAYSTLCCIPRTVVDDDFAGFGLQTLTEYSTLTSYDAFVNTKCKVKNSVDEKMAYMYDVILENVVYDLVVIGGFGDIRSIMISKLPTARNASVYATLYKKTEGNINGDIIHLLNSIG